MTTALVPTFGMVVLEDSKTEEGLRQQHKSLMDNILEAEEKLRDAEVLVNKMESDLQRASSDLVSKIVELENEIKLMQIELGEREDFEDEDVGDSEDTDMDDLESENTKTEFDFTEEARALYKKIAKHCHPDKTNDSELNEIFVRAAKAMREQDWETIIILAELVDEIAKHGSSIMMKLLGKITGLRAKLQDVLARLNSVLNGEDYQLAYNYFNGPPQVKQLIEVNHRSALQRVLQNMMAEREHLRSRLLFGDRDASSEVESLNEALSRFGIINEESDPEIPEVEDEPKKRPSWWDKVFGD